MGESQKGVHRNSFEWCEKVCSVFEAGERTEARGRTIDRGQVVPPEDWKIVYRYIQPRDP